MGDRTETSLTVDDGLLFLGRLPLLFPRADTPDSDTSVTMILRQTMTFDAVYCQPLAKQTAALAKVTQL